MVVHHHRPRPRSERHPATLARANGGGAQPTQSTEDALSERDLDMFERSGSVTQRPLLGRRRSLMQVAGGALLLAVLVAGLLLWMRRPVAPAPSRVAAGGALPLVVVAHPIRTSASSRSVFYGQFSAVSTVQIRAQVGGPLTAIYFRDGQVVHQGDPLFLIDPRPYEIRRQEAIAALSTAQANLTLANVELWRAQQLKQTQFGTVETVDERRAQEQASASAVLADEQAIKDAQLDLEYCHITSPLTGRIGAHQVAAGNLVSGSRAGTSATTLLATIVSEDPIYLDFDMSENDYLAYKKAQLGAHRAVPIRFRLSDETGFDRTGTLDFLDNVVDTGTGTLHARATIPNPEQLYTPGAFATVQVPTSDVHPVVLIPDSVVSLDQSGHAVDVVSPDGTVAARAVTLGGFIDGLRVVTSGLDERDLVVTDGLIALRPGAKVRMQTVPIHRTVAAAVD